MTITPQRASRFAVNVRIPGWAREQPVPSNLYVYTDEINVPSPSLRVNGSPAPVTIANGFATVDRMWAAGDVLTLDLAMPVRRVESHAQVMANRGRVALQRGPIVFAAEWPDNPNGKVRNIVLPDSSRLSSEYRGGLMNGVQVITGRAVGLSYDARGAVQRAEQPFMAIPYATWANRGRGQMAVWLARTDAAARPTPFPTVVTTATIAASPLPNGRGKNPRNIIDGEEPASSSDSTAYFDWWPVQGSASEWIELTFAKPATVSTSEVYWFDDTGRGGVRVPASWRLLYKSGDSWVTVDAKNGYGVERNRWNGVSFTPITTTALRIELAMQQGFSAGLQEWRVK